MARWRPAQTTLLVEVVRGAAGLFVPAAAASIHKTSLFVEHGVQTMIRPRGRKRPPRCTTLCVCGAGSQVMKGQACRCGGEGTRYYHRLCACREHDLCDLLG